MTKIVFENDFEFGTATAAYQVEGAWQEGGKGENIWDRFTHTKGKIADGTNGDVADDFYHRYREDIALAKELNMQVYRFSISWARIFPEGTGTVNQEGIDFYRNVLMEMKKAGIKTSVTMYHWDLPQKLQDRGGWANRESVEWFENYAKTLLTEFGDLVDYWITFNEPFCTAYLGYWKGEHAPGYQDYSMMLQCVHHLLMSHGTAVKLFRNMKLNSEIGITLNMSTYYPWDVNNEQDVEAAHRMTMERNNLYADPIWKGSYPQELFDYLKTQGVTLPDIRKGDMELIQQIPDFFGLNHYYSEFVKADENVWPLHTQSLQKGLPTTDAEWEVIPEGFYDLLLWIHKTYQPSKVIVTENGACINDWITPEGEVHDDNRISFLKLYLQAMREAMDAGVPVKGYYVWSFTDNFEWAWGNRRRFGIVYVDYKTQRRIVKKSARWYAELIEKHQFEVM